MDPTLTLSRTIVVLALVLLPSPSVYAQPGPKERYGFEKAKIVIEKTTKNKSLESTEIDTVYLDEWGWQEVRHVYVKQNLMMLNQTTESRSVSILAGDSLIWYDPDRRNGVRTPNPFFWNADSGRKGQRVGEGLSKDLKTTTTSKGTEEIAGRTCEVVETRTEGEGLESVTTTWTWRQFVMKSVVNAAGTEITETVLSIDEKVGISPELLKVPDDVQILYHSIN